MGDVHYEKRGPVALVRIDANEVKNGLTSEMAHRLADICGEIDADAAVGAAVLTGDHGTFCSGADTRRWNLGADPAKDTNFKEIGAVYNGFVRWGNVSVPTIAAVRGAAVGAGMNLMLASDLRIVAQDARLISGFLRVGVHPGGGFFSLIGRTGSRDAAAAMGLFGEEINGDRARELGLAWESHPADEVLPRSLQLAEQVAGDPELAREAVRSFRMELGPPQMTWDHAVHFERATQMWSFRRRTR